MENLHGNMHALVFSCLKFTKQYVFLYFLYLVPPLTPYYIIMVKGLLEIII